MPYNKPDVFVTVDLSAASVTVPSPELVPLIIGEHFFVASEKYAGFVDAGESTTLAYPGPPKSKNDTTKYLAVDVTSQFKPSVKMILGNGEEVDVTSKLSFTSSGIVKTPIVETYNGVPYSGSLYVTYRALDDRYAGNFAELLEAASTVDLVAYFGADGIVPANPLGYGMYQAMLHGGIKVAGLAVGDLPDQNGAGTYSGALSDVTLSYAAALDFSKAYDLYMVVPMTSNDYVLDTVLAHVNAMTTSYKQERRMIFAPAFSDYWPIRGDEDHYIWHSIIGNDTAALAWLNGGLDPSVVKNITATADNGSGLIRATSADHGLTTGDSIELTGITDAPNGTYTVTVITTSTFDIDDSTYTGPTDTGTFKASESAIGSEIVLGTGEKVLRIATGDGTVFGTYIVRGVSLASGGSILDTDVVVLNTKNVTVELYDGSADRKFWVELSSSALEVPSTRLRVGDRFHVFGTTFSDAYMGTVEMVGVASNDRLVQVLTGDVQYAHFDDAYTAQVRFYREKTAKAIVSGIHDMAKAYGTERLVLIGPDTVAINGVDVASFYVAAQLGAELCQVGRKAAGAEPGAFPFTGVRDSIVATWKSTRYFTDDQLDTAAEGGFTWLVNDYVGGPVTTRDTITTNPGTIETRDIVLGVERDFLAKTFRKALRPDLRKFRIDKALLTRIAMTAAAIASKYTNATSSTRTFKNISIKSVTQDPLSPDSVILVVEATHLYVLKYVHVTLRIVI